MSCIDSIAVYPQTKTIQVGKWYSNAHAEVCPADAPCRSVVWSSDNTSVATVNPTLGEIWGNSLGTAKIYATATDGSGISGYMTVTVVTTVPVESVRLNHSNLSIAKGHSASLTAIVCPENATNPSLNWSSNNEGVATVVNGTISAISEGTAIITATAKDGSGKSASCTVTVTNGILVSSITVNPSEKIMTVGDSAFLSATVYPSNATKKSVCWRSDNPNAVTVNENSGLIVAQNPGTAGIYATACDGGGAQGYCEVTVEEPIKVECVCVYPQKTTIAPNEKQYISAYVDPVIATKPYVTWKSSNTNIVTVEKISSGLSYISNAEIIGKNKGTATITATATDGSNKKSSCTVTVDPRERVTVKKVSDYFVVNFSNGPEWRSISCDMSLPENNSGVVMWLPETPKYEHEKRCLFNLGQKYDAKQLALLYILDPWGVEYYFRNYKLEDFKKWFSDEYSATCSTFEEWLRVFLKFKDNVYKIVFGVSPKPFTISNSGQRVEIIRDYDRIDVYTDAELIFGSHSINNVPDLIENLIDIGLNMAEKIMSDTTKNKLILAGINVLKTWIFSGSFTEALSSEAMDFLSDYVDDSEDDDSDMLEWTKSLLDSIYALSQGISDIIRLSNIHDIKIYTKIKNQDIYIVQFDSGSKEMLMDEVIDLCS